MIWWWWCVMCAMEQVAKKNQPFNIIYQRTCNQAWFPLLICLLGSKIRAALLCILFRKLGKKQYRIQNVHMFVSHPVWEQRLNERIRHQSVKKGSLNSDVLLSSPSSCCPEEEEAKKRKRKVAIKYNFSFSPFIFQRRFFCTLMWVEWIAYIVSGQIYPWRCLVLPNA